MYDAFNLSVPLLQPLSQKKSDRLSFYFLSMQSWMDRNLPLTFSKRIQGSTCYYTYSSAELGPLFSNQTGLYVDLIFELSSSDTEIESFKVTFNKNTYDITTKKAMEDLQSALLNGI